MTTAHETSLSQLSDHDWNVLRSRWSRGMDWNIEKTGRKWAIGGRLGQGFPLFKTKTAAYDAASNLICAESLWRSLKAA